MEMRPFDVPVKNNLQPLRDFVAEAARKFDEEFPGKTPGTLWMVVHLPYQSSYFAVNMRTLPEDVLHARSQGSYADASSATVSDLLLLQDQTRICAVLQDNILEGVSIFFSDIHACII